MFMGLLIVSRAAGSDTFFLQKDLVGAIVDGETAKQQFRGTGETVTETGSESHGLYGFFEGEGPSSTSRKLHEHRDEDEEDDGGAATGRVERLAYGGGNL